MPFPRIRAGRDIFEILLVCGKTKLTNNPAVELVPFYKRHSAKIMRNSVGYAVWLADVANAQRKLDSPKPHSPLGVLEVAFGRLHPLPVPTTTFAAPATVCPT